MSNEIFVAFATQKGGIGKSTVTALAASYLHNVQGHNVAVIDCDAPQHSIHGLRERETKLIDQTTAAIPTQEAATSEKGIELSEEEATFDDGNTETVSRPAQVPEEKLDETFTSIPPSELEFGEDEPEDGTPDTPRATGSSFDEIDDAVRAAKNPEATKAERERAAKVFSDMEGTELYEKLMSGSTELSIRIKGLIEVRLKKPKKEFTVPDNIDEFNIRDYV